MSGRNPGEKQSWFGGLGVTLSCEVPVEDLVSDTKIMGVGGYVGS